MRHDDTHDSSAYWVNIDIRVCVYVHTLVYIYMLTFIFVVSRWSGLYEPIRCRSGSTSLLNWTCASLFGLGSNIA